MALLVAYSISYIEFHITIFDPSFLRMYSLMLRVTMAGRMICMMNILISTVAAGSVWIMVCHVMICPTSPAVPIPEPVALLVI